MQSIAHTFRLAHTFGLGRTVGLAHTVCLARTFRIAAPGLIVQGLATFCQSEEKPLPHFGGCFPRERDRRHLLDRNAASDERDHSFYQDRCFTRTRTRPNKQVSVQHKSRILDRGPIVSPKSANGLARFAINQNLAHSVILPVA